jgi:hypothetical protein
MGDAVSVGGIHLSQQSDPLFADSKTVARTLPRSVRFYWRHSGSTTSLSLLSRVGEERRDLRHPADGIPHRDLGPNR